ncbi:MAG: metal-sensing transcriptional repressor [Lachnospiraceae bacterium]|nr:metal-sensing transcriptional repressor [Lachnospiraceae bacterium]MDE6761537.1 metal-sensing transcriptional repressor [Lachnospiraceae bacterium]
MEKCKKECAHCQTKQREEAEFKKLMNRLNRIEGQVRGVKGMLEKDAYCIDIITQVAAIQSALAGFNKALLKEHISTCVVEDVKQGKEDKVEELINTLQKLM